jgi:hypothetical protein
MRFTMASRAENIISATIRAWVGTFPHRMARISVEI